MHPLKFLSILISCLLCLSCAAGSVSQRQARDVRDQTRILNKGVALYTKGCYAHALELFNEALGEWETTRFSGFQSESRVSAACP